MRYVLPEPISLEEKDGLLLIEFQEKSCVVEMYGKKYNYNYGRLFRKNRFQIPKICRAIDKLSPKYIKPIYSEVTRKIFEIKSNGEDIPEEILNFMILLFIHSPSSLFRPDYKDKFIRLFGSKVDSFGRLAPLDNYVYQPQPIVKEKIERWELEDLRSGLDNWRD